MGRAARCDICLTNFPPEMDAAECPVCDIGCLETGWGKSLEPDEDWEEKANQAEFKRYYERTRGRSLED